MPAPQNRSATFLAPLTASTARLTMAVSAAGAACRKAAGGRGTVARPKVMRGWRAITSVSPSRLSRARPASAAAAMARAVTSAVKPPDFFSTPVTSTSSPVSVRVTCRVGADFGCPRKGAATLASPGRAAIKAGSDTGHSVSSTSRHDRRALNPSRTRPPGPLRACRARRRRLA
ncbi:hypothetical protein D3C86_1617540 [compost metagenome]